MDDFSFYIEYMYLANILKPCGQWEAHSLCYLSEVSAEKKYSSLLNHNTDICMVWLLTDNSLASKIH